MFLSSILDLLDFFILFKFSNIFYKHCITLSFFSSLVHVVLGTIVIFIKHTITLSSNELWKLKLSWVESHFGNSKKNYLDIKSFGFQVSFACFH
jgi:hypothetical protein